MRRPVPRARAALRNGGGSGGSSPHDDGRRHPKCAILCGITDTTNDTFRTPTPIDAQRVLGLLAAAVPIASVVALDPSGWFPFSVAKWWAVVVLGLASMAATLAATALPLRSDCATSRPSSRTDRVGLALFGLLIGLTGLSTISALDGVYALIGTPVRHLGAMTWLFFGAMYLVGRRVAASDRSVESMMHGVVLAGLAVGCYCVVEAFFGAPVEFAADTSRLGGPFGSAAYLGAACCLLGPVAVGVAADSASSRPWRVTAGSAAALLAFALMGSGSRAAVLGMLIAGVIAVAARPVRWRRVERATGFWAVAPTIALAVGVAIAAVAGVFERSTGWASRFDEWRIAVQAIADHPLLGVGPEGYRLVVGRYLDADYVATYGEAVGIDRAHSGLLDVALASGAVSAVVYLVLLGFVGWRAVRLMRSGTRVDVGSAVAVVAYGLQQQLLFPIAELDPLFWLLAGVVVVRSWPAKSLDEPGRRAPRRSSTILLVASAAVGLLAIGAAVVGLRSVAADRLALDAQGRRDVDVAIETAERAAGLAPLDIRHLLLLARAHEQERSLGGVDRALAAIDEAREISPLDPVVRFEHARLLSLRADITGTDIDELAATQAWGALLADEPLCERCRRAAGGD